MSKSPKPQGPTQEEIQLAQQAQTKYNAAQKLGGAASYLTKVSQVDTSNREYEKSKATNAAALGQLPTIAEETLPMDLRGMTGGLVAGKAQSESDNAATQFDLANANLGVMASNSSAAYAEGQREMAVNAAEQRLEDQKDAFLPNVAGTALGTYLTGGFDGAASKLKEWIPASKKKVGDTLARNTPKGV